MSRAGAVAIAAPPALCSFRGKDMDPIVKVQVEHETEKKDEGIARESSVRGRGRRSPRTGEGGRGGLGLLKVLPYFLGASFFLSGFLAFLSPFPFLYLLYFSEPSPRGSVKPRLRPSLPLALATNSALVFAASGTLESVLVFAWVAGLPALFLPVFLERTRSLDRSVLMLWSILMLSILGIWLGASGLSGISPLVALDQTLGAALKGWMEALAPEARQAVLGEVEYVEWKRAVFRELPSATGIFCLLLSVLNTLTLLRWNPGGIQKSLGLRADFTRRWRAPEWLIWPSILLLAAQLWGAGVVGLVGDNGVRLLMAVYFFQGLSILAFVLDLWRVRGWFRVLAYGFTFMTMLPLLIALGFFDTWFDFRKKLRQT
jgi:hypothetical protein